MINITHNLILFSMWRKMYKMSAKTKTPSKTGKSPSKGPAKGKKRKTNLLRLCSEMNKYVTDANDKEIIKRFKKHHKL